VPAAASTSAIAWINIVPRLGGVDHASPFLRAVIIAPAAGGGAAALPFYQGGYTWQVYWTLPSAGQWEFHVTTEVNQTGGIPELQIDNPQLQVLITRGDN
jgi:hypothetical protein